MNIHISALRGLPAAVAADQRPKSGARSGAGDAKRSVSISAAAQQLASLHMGDADVDLARVEEIRTAIAAGTLPIDTRRIADGLIVSARELLTEDPSRARTAQ